MLCSIPLLEMNNWCKLILELSHSIIIRDFRMTPISHPKRVLDLGHISSSNSYCFSIKKQPQFLTERYVALVEISIGNAGSDLGLFLLER